MPELRVVELPAVLTVRHVLTHVLPIGRSKLYTMIADRDFPEPDLFIGKVPCWRAQTVLAWLDEQQGAGRGDEERTRLDRLHQARREAGTRDRRQRRGAKAGISPTSAPPGGIVGSASNKGR